MANIKQNKVISLNIKFLKEFKGGELMESSFARVTPIVSNLYPDAVDAIVELISEWNGLTTDFNMNAQIAISYRLSRKKDVNDVDLFKCIELTVSHLQNSVNEIFSGYSIPRVPAIIYEDISDILVQHIQNLRL